MLLLVMAAAGAPTPGCLDPTQVTVRLSTDLDCSAVAARGVAIHGDLLAREPSVAVTRACADPGAGSTREIGTLVVTPARNKDGEVVLSTVLGVTRPTEECAANAFVGCIVAKRRFKYVPHEPLEMPIVLSSSCLDRPCSPEDTCFRGACVSATSEARNGCLGPDCEGTPADAGGPSSDDASLDAVGDTSADVVTDTSIDLDANATLTFTRWKNLSTSARGLALSPTDIYWTEPGLDGVAHAPLVGGGGNTVIPLGAGDYWGVAVSGTNVLVGGLSDVGACAYESPGGPALACDGFAGFGVGFGLLSNVYVTVPTQNRLDTFVSNLPTTFDVNTMLRYLETDGDSWYATDGTGVFTGDSFDITPFQRPVPGAYGIALSPSHVFVTTSDGKLHAISRSVTGPMREYATPFESAEDAAYAADTQTLYVAAKEKGGTWAIWTVTQLAASLP